MVLSNKPILPQQTIRMQIKSSVLWQNMIYNNLNNLRFSFAYMKTKSIIYICTLMYLNQV